MAFVPVPQQIARRAIPWECFEQLTSYPFRREIFRHGRVDKPTPIVRQNYEDEQTNNTRKNTVGTTKKSDETMSFIGFAKNVRQP